MISRRSESQVVALTGLACAVVVLLSAEPVALSADKEKKVEEKPGPPRVIVALPIAVTGGTTNRVRVRGQNLAEATEVRFTNAPGVVVKIHSKTKLDLPKDAEAKKVGDTQMELDLSFPAGPTPITNFFTVTSSLGTSAAHPILVLPEGALVEEQEPNGGFDRAQIVSPGPTVHGVLREEADVDVFRVEARPGRWLVAEVRSARWGAALDPVLTLHDPGGAVLAESDDASGHRDALLRFRMPAGRAWYYLSLVDALNRGGPAYEYLLDVRYE